MAVASTEDLVFARLADAGPNEGGSRTITDLADALSSGDRFSDRIALVSTVEGLEEEGLIDIVVPEDAGVADGSIRIEVTEAGRERGQRIREQLADTTVELVDDGRRRVSLERAADELDRPLVELAARATDEGVVYTEATPDREFVGRGDATERCRAYVADATAGEGGALMLAGPAGVGKTTLADRLLSDLEGVDVLRARCRGDAGAPFQPLRDALAPVVEDPFEAVGPDVDDPEAFAAQQTALFTDLTDRLTPGEDDPPRLVYLDDLHLADRGTFAYLSQVLGDLAGRRLALVGSYRPTELPEDAPVAPGVADVDHVELDPFGVEATRKLVEGVVGKHGVPDGFVAAVHERTGGVPLFVEKTVETLLDTEQVDPDLQVYPESVEEIDVPDEVRETIDHRVEQFPTPARDLLRWAAVVGEQVSVPLLEAAADHPPANLRTYLAAFADAAVLVPTDDGLQFRSEVMREALLERLSPEDRRWRHERVAELLEDSDRDAPAEVAYHHDRAGNDAKAIEWYRKAGRQATDVYAHETAIEYLEQGLALARDADDREALVDISLTVAGVQRTLGDYEEARRFATFARERADGPDDERRALVHLGGIATSRGDHERAVDLADEGLDGDPEPDGTVCQLLATKCQAYLKLSEYDDAERLARRQRELAETAAVPEMVATALGTLGNVARERGDYEVALEYYEEQRSLCREEGLRRKAADSLNAIGRIARKRGDYAAAREYFEESLEICREIGDRHSTALRLNNLGTTAYGHGDYGAAREDYEECLDILRDLGDHHRAGKVLVNLGEIARIQGDYDTAREYTRESLERLREVGDRHSAAKALTNLGVVAREAGDLETAGEHIREGLSILRELGDRHGVATSLSSLGEVLEQRGEYADARERYAEALGILREVNVPHVEAGTLRGLGRTAGELGDHDDAREHLAAASDLAGEVGNPVLAAVCEARLGAVEFDDDDADAGAEHGDAALSLLEDAPVAVTPEIDPLDALGQLVERCEAAGDPERAREWCDRIIAAVGDSVADDRLAAFERGRERPDR